jgi:AraC-like DNA-binding protein
MRPCRITKSLEQVGDWNELALEAEYCSRHMANLLDVEERTLRRFFVKKFGRPTRQQLEIFRQESVEQMARAGVPEKVITLELYFKYTSNFSRRFKAFHGVSFRAWIKRLANHSLGLSALICPNLIT